MTESRRTMLRAGRPPTPQGQGGVTGPSAVAQGGSITVQVEQGTSSITVHTGGPTEQVIPVPPGGSVTIPIPNVPAGVVVVITSGGGLTKSILYVEVISPGP